MLITILAPNLGVFRSQNFTQQPKQNGLVVQAKYHVVIPHSALPTY